MATHEVDVVYSIARCMCHCSLTPLSPMSAACYTHDLAAVFFESTVNLGTQGNSARTATAGRRCTGSRSAALGTATAARSSARPTGMQPSACCPAAVRTVSFNRTTDRAYLLQNRSRGPWPPLAVDSSLLDCAPGCHAPARLRGCEVTSEHAGAAEEFPPVTAGEWLMKRRDAEYGAKQALRVE